MAKQSPIYGAVLGGATAFLAAAKRAWPGERLYGFLLEVSAEGNDVFAVAGTEEGLVRVADAYAKKGYGTKKYDSAKLL